MEFGAISGKDKGKGIQGKDRGKEKKGGKTKSKLQKGGKADIRWQKKSTWNGKPVVPCEGYCKHCSK